MSTQDVERFVQDLRRSAELLAVDLGVRVGTIGLTELVERARSEGYDFDIDDLKVYVREELPKISIRELASELDQVTDTAVTTEVSTNIEIVALIVPFVTGSGLGRRRTQ